MKRRELFRRSLAATLGTALGGSSTAGLSEAFAREFPEGFDASRELASPDWKPRFLTAHQNETLITLSDWIIPETETPGAVAALANRFIDRLLAAEDGETQRAFLAGLAYLDGESRRAWGDAFIYLEPAQQKDLLTFMAFPHRLVTWGDNISDDGGHEHFSLLKEWIARAYYSSEAGQKELGWQDAPFHGEFEGCGHEEGDHE